VNLLILASEKFFFIDQSIPWDMLEVNKK